MILEFAGISASGKTTLAAELKTLLETGGKTVIFSTGFDFFTAKAGSNDQHISIKSVPSGLLRCPQMWRTFIKLCLLGYRNRKGNVKWRHYVKQATRFLLTYRRIFGYQSKHITSDKELFFADEGIVNLLASTLHLNAMTEQNRRAIAKILLQLSNCGDICVVYCKASTDWIIRNGQKRENKNRPHDLPLPGRIAAVDHKQVVTQVLIDCLPESVKKITITMDNTGAAEKAQELLEKLETVI